MLSHQLAIEAYNQSIKLPAYYYVFLNIQKCFDEKYNMHQNINTISGMMQVLQLKESPEFPPPEYQNIVRIANRLAKDQYKFYKPKKRTLSSLFSLDKNSNSTNEKNIMAIPSSLPTMLQMSIPLQRERSRDREYLNYVTKAYARINNLPPDCTPGDICEFMHGIHIKCGVKQEFKIKINI